MVDLVAKSPVSGMATIEVGSVTLREADLGHLTSLAPYKGQEAALSEVLKAAHGVVFPSPNRATGKEGARVLWFGHKMALLAGPAPDAALAQHAALTDQSDAWSCVRLDGEGSREVLSRLTPLDLRVSQFKRGHTARAELQHMAASITRLAENGYLILTFRSVAQTLCHDIEQVMRGVAAR